MTYDFSISPEDFDVSLLPQEARTVESPEFGEAVHAYLTKEFQDFGGTARIIVSDELIHVTWTPDYAATDPLRVATEKLNRGQFAEAVQLLEFLRSGSPDDRDILHSLGTALLKGGRTAEAEEVLRRVVEMNSSDQEAWFGLAEAVFAQDRLEDADEVYLKVIEIDASSKVAELARERRGEIATKLFRSKTPGMERMDAVMYLAGAIEKFGGMSRQEVQKIGYEVAMMGREGFDVNDSGEKYQLRSMPGRFSGLHMVSLMYAAFKIINPTADIGFDLTQEYAVAQQMKRDQRNT